MNFHRLAVAGLMLALSAPIVIAGETAPPSKPKPKPAPVIGGYQLDLKTKLDSNSVPAPPPGTSALAREPTTPFLGLSLTRPLGN